ncbi:hypothetical protein F4604DRAFT_1692854 [Suillus subluteus]|nr:hypothetical protein F4604DRAFT_1692854 [Suillus subluteus]
MLIPIGRPSQWTATLMEIVRQDITLSVWDWAMWDEDFTNTYSNGREYNRAVTVTDFHLPLAIVPLEDATAPRSSSRHDSMTDGTPLPSIEQSCPNPPNNCVVLIQNNYVAEGGTINIFSSHCNGSTVTKLEHVKTTAEPTPLEPPPARQAEPAEHCRESIVLSGNTFGECVMINVGSPNCTGAVKQTALASQIDRNV